MQGTSGPNPLALASVLRKEVSRVRPEFYVSNIRTQKELVESRIVRERLLAMLALFFAGVAVLLAGIGMYGVLDYSVVQRRLEIGIRMAIGAQAGDIVRRVTGETFAMVLIGSAAGDQRSAWRRAQFAGALLFGVKPSDVTMVAIPAAMVLSAVFLAALPAVLRALRIDPATMLRAE